MHLYTCIHVYVYIYIYICIYCLHICTYVARRIHAKPGASDLRRLQGAIEQCIKHMQIYMCRCSLMIINIILIIILIILIIVITIIISG